MTTSKTTVKKFAWNKDTATQASQLYAELLGGNYNADKNEIVYPADFEPTQEQHAKANSEKALNDIAQQIGAKSGRAVRGKLSKEGVYIALEAQPAPSTATRVTKGQYVKAFSVGLGLDLETIQTFDKPNLEALEAFTAGINKVLAAANQPLIVIK